MQDEICELVTSVWDTMLDGGILPVDSDGTTVLNKEPVRGSIEISGVWSGSLALELSGADAGRAASIMLETSPGDLAREDVNDVVGELINIIAGNFKALLPQPLKLGLPIVTAVEGTHGDEAIEDSAIRFYFEWKGSPLVIELATADGQLGMSP